MYSESKLFSHEPKNLACSKTNFLIVSLSTLEGTIHWDPSWKDTFRFKPLQDGGFPGASVSFEQYNVGTMAGRKLSLDSFDHRGSAKKHILPVYWATYDVRIWTHALNMSRFPHTHYLESQGNLTRIKLTQQFAAEPYDSEFKIARGQLGWHL
jgi:hypothetical protein